jgi:nucleoside-diphosphate-sugar epimerase
MERVLVTGGGGYIGSILCGALLERGFGVTVLDSFVHGQNSLAQYCSSKKFTIIDGDARVERTLVEAVRDADIVIPLAGLVGAPLCDRDSIGARTTNVDGPLLLFRLLSSSQLVLMPTTNSAYGTGETGRYLDETSPLHPLSTYAAQKVEVEQALMQRENSISLRLATVFGMSPKMRLDLLVNDFTYRAVRDRAVVLFEGQFKRNFIHVRDVSRAFIHCMDRVGGMRGQIFNVGLSEANLSKIELCQAIQRQVPGFTFIEAPVGQDPDRRNYLISNAKIEATGFKPGFSLDDGIRELVVGYRMIRNSKYANV